MASGLQLYRTYAHIINVFHGREREGGHYCEINEEPETGLLRIKYIDANGTERNPFRESKKFQSLQEDTKPEYLTYFEPKSNIHATGFKTANYTNMYRNCSYNGIIHVWRNFIPSRTIEGVFYESCYTPLEELGPDYISQHCFIDLDTFLKRAIMEKLRIRDGHTTVQSTIGTIGDEWYIYYKLNRDENQLIVHDEEYLVHADVQYHKRQITYKSTPKKEPERTFLRINLHWSEDPSKDLINKSHYIKVGENKDGSDETYKSYEDKHIKVTATIADNTHNIRILSDEEYSIERNIGAGIRNAGAGGGGPVYSAQSETPVSGKIGGPESDIQSPEVPRRSKKKTFNAGLSRGVQGEKQCSRSDEALGKCTIMGGKRKKQRNKIKTAKKRHAKSKKARK